MAAHNFLAFDLGAESGRAVLGTLDSGRLELEEKHRFPNPTGRMNGRLQWNLLGQWEELKTGLRKSADSHGGGRASLSGIGVDTWGVDFGLLNGDGDVVSNPFHYRDGWTEGVPDSDRYTMLGNTMQVGTAEWLGRRLMSVHSKLSTIGA